MANWPFFDIKKCRLTPLQFDFFLGCAGMVFFISFLLAIVNHFQLVLVL